MSGWLLPGDDFPDWPEPGSPGAQLVTVLQKSNPIMNIETQEARSTNISKNLLKIPKK
jgi:hypothetical protein